MQTKAKLDYEAKNSYVVTVTATDSDGLSDSIDVTITVTDMDEAPEIIVGGLAISGETRVDYEENGTGMVATYALVGPNADSSGRWMTLGGADAGDFSISNSGVLSFRSSPNYEAPADEDMDNVYMVTLTARDSDNTAMRAVVVTVTDVDETGAVTAISGNARVDSVLTAGTVTDPDGSVGGRMWMWERSMDGTAWSAISGATSSMYTAMAGDVGYYLRVKVTYTDPQGSGKMATSAMTAKVVAAPEFAVTPAERSVAENTAAGMDIGAPVEATDADIVTLTYTLRGADAASFAINPATGQLMTSAALDFETETSYTVDVTATDPSGLSATVLVTVMVTDVDDMGMVTLSLMQPTVGVELTAMLSDDDMAEADMATVNVAVGQFRCHEWDLYQHY